MKVIEAERLINKWKEAKERKAEFRRMKLFATEDNRNVATIVLGSSRIELKPEEQQMIFNILNNTITEREKNYREMLKEQLNIHEEA
jgi:hypothetical protein